MNRQITGTTVASGYPQHWRRPPFISRPWLRYGLALAAVLYLIVGIGSVEVTGRGYGMGFQGAGPLSPGFLPLIFFPAARIFVPEFSKA
jgi:phosphonate transport system permease protein